MAKWTLSNAAAHRIVSGYYEAQIIDGGRKSPFALLVELADKEGLQGRSVIRELIGWIGENRPQLLPPIAIDLYGQFDSLHNAATDYLSAQEQLSYELQYKHRHDHASED